MPPGLAGGNSVHEMTAETLSYFRLEKLNGNFIPVSSLTVNLFLFFFEMGSLYVAILELVLFVDQAGHRNHPDSALPLQYYY